jgi:5'-3' exonuclease
MKDENPYFLKAAYKGKFLILAAFLCAANVLLAIFDIRDSIDNHVRIFRRTKSLILIDYSQIVVSNLHQLLKKNPEDDQFKIEPNLLRHMILNSIRKNNRQFKEYGQMVICADSHSYWRKQYFPQYKANRKKDRDESEIDWPMVFETLDAVRDELRKYFPYHVLNVPLAEADDIIGVLTKRFKRYEPILIVSSDKDFIQLLDENVALYRPIQDELVLFNPIDLSAIPQDDIVAGCSVPPYGLVEG